MGEELAALRTLAMRTEIAVSTYGCELVRRQPAGQPGYWVVRTPDNPHYWFGNCLIFDAPPQDGDLERWLALFDREHAGCPSAHRVFRVDSAQGEAGHAQPFVDAGFEIERAHILSTRSVVPPAKVNRAIDVRPLRSVSDWQAALALEVDVGIRDDGHREVEAFVSFQRDRQATYRRMVERGLGEVWGAFLGAKLVGKLGLFHVGKLSRFQHVATHHDHRRQGVCGTLVHRVSQQALAEVPSRCLVMLAFEDYHATRIYQSLGYRVTERLVDFKRPPPGAMR